MKLYFIRHGRAEWNEEGRFQGSSGDSPLLPTSIHQLEKLGKHLATVPFDAAYSSYLPRAAHTAQIILDQLEKPIELQLTSALREWKLGKLEGAKIATITSIYPQQMEAFRHNLARFQNEIFDAESVYDTTKRTCDFVKSLKGKELDTVLIIGHGANLTASIRTLLGYETGELRKNGGLNNASVTILTTDDFEHYHLDTWNDTSYTED